LIPTSSITPASESERAGSPPIEVALNGALFTWALYQEGMATRFLRGAVDAVLAPYLPKRRRGRLKRGTGQPRRSG
jgi:hypothetical protein